MNQDIAGQVTQFFYPLMSLAVLLVACLKFSQSYWGRMLITAASVQLATSLFWRISFLARNGPDMAWFDRVQSVMQAVGMYSETLFLLALASIPFARKNAISSPLPPALGPAGSERSVGALLLLLPVTINIYWMFWLHRVVREIRQFAPDALKFTPGQAVGYMFIPFFNLYWFFRVLIDVTKVISRLNEHFRARDARLDSGFSGGAVTFLLFLAMVLNGLGSLHYGFFLTGEALFLTCLAHTQRQVNQIWRAAALPAL